MQSSCINTKIVSLTKSKIKAINRRERVIGSNSPSPQQPPITVISRWQKPLNLITLTLQMLIYPRNPESLVPLGLLASSGMDVFHLHSVPRSRKTRATAKGNMNASKNWRQQDGKCGAFEKKNVYLYWIWAKEISLACSSVGKTDSDPTKKTPVALRFLGESWINRFFTYIGFCFLALLALHANFRFFIIRSQPNSTVHIFHRSCQCS